MASLNRWTGIGFLGADPEYRLTGSGVQCANFRVACTETWTKDGQKHEKTEWITCVAWRQTAEHAKRFLRKGSKVYVEGKFTTRTWEDKNGGGKRYASEILVDTFQSLDKIDARAPEPGESYGYPDQPTPQTRPHDADDSDLPF